MSISISTPTPTPTPTHNNSNATTTTNTHTQQFHLFPLLPTELRLLIWHLVLAEPRTVHLKCHRGVHPLLKRRFARSFEALTPPPASLFVNREARGEAVGLYKEWFRVDESVYFAGAAADQSKNETQKAQSQSQSQPQSQPTPTPTPAPRLHSSHPKAQPSGNPSPRAIYIAFTRDTLHLREDVLAYIPPAEAGLIERLIVDVADVHYFGHFYLDVIRSMGKLRTLDLVVGFTESDWLLAGRDRANGNGDGSGLGRLQRGVGLLEDEFLEMKGRYSDWRFPNVRVLMRDTGDVLAMISGEEELGL
ncbi:hypothetical protein BDW69DRAFT_159153 [Aspergillus filifer]